MNRLLLALVAALLFSAACSSGLIVDDPGTEPTQSPTGETVAQTPPSATQEANQRAPTSTPIPTPTNSPPSADTPSSQQETAPLTEMDVKQVFTGLSFGEITYLTIPHDGSNRIFVTQKEGAIAVFPNDQSVTSFDTFLDISAKVNSDGSEEGLLGLAFDPSFEQNGYFYVYYTASDPDRSVLSRFSVSEANPNQADPASERVILEVEQPYANHNGGQVLFGPDGYLYLGLGDGGSGGDPHDHGQNLSTLLGSIIRIDVSTLDSQGAYLIPLDNPFVGRDDARPEIWAYGLRNPWRFNFDPVTGLMWAADVGEDEYEEIDIIRPGGNYGWNIMEGSHCHEPSSGCDQEGLELPVAEYSHDDGCSITGGYVYRNQRLPSLYGAYLYADYCSGRVWALRYDGVEVTEQMELLNSDLQISSFGVDQSGEVYILTLDGGIYRLEPRDDGNGNGD